MRLTTIKQLLQRAYKRIDPLDAELLLAFVLKKPREFVIAHPERRVNRCVSAQVCKLVKKRCAGVPLAYLTGQKEFFGLDFFVNRNVLIPRPETEVLVESVLSECRTQITEGEKIALVDVGTGSGCIPIALTTSLHHHITSSPETFAIDISKSALRVAKLNAKKHGVKIKFLHGNLLTPFLKTCALACPPVPGVGRRANLRTCLPASARRWQAGKLIVTANLPYLTNKQYENSPAIQREPKSALVAGKTGLELYEKLLKQIKRLSNKTQNTINKTQLMNRGPQLAAFFEIDPAQSWAIKNLIKKHLPNAKMQIKKDLAGLNRVVTILT